MPDRIGDPRPLDRDDDRAAFDSGDAALDDWLRRHALVNRAAGGANTFVACDGAGVVVGYYALSATSVQKAASTTRAAHGMPDPVPAVLLGRLAVDRRMQGSGLGSRLLRDALLRTLEAADVVGVRLVLVHAATPAAAAFYRRFDFESSPTDPMHLMMLLKDVRRAARQP